MRLDLRSDRIKVGNESPTAFMGNDLDQPFFAFITEDDVAAGQNHVSGSIIRLGGYPYLAVGKAQVPW
jgi:hypothetical protein